MKHIFKNKRMTVRNLLILFVFLLAGCVDSERKKAYEDCIERGVKYFKEIGSYPTLSSAPNRGRKAEDVAAERCRRTTGAFG